jgi:centrosomal protein CEP164
MDPGDDQQLYYIAKEGLKAPLPSNWKPCKAGDNQIYYFNFETKELQKEHPCDDHYKKQFMREKENRIQERE